MGVQPKATFSQKIEAIINTANHVAIGTISIYLTVICWNAGPTTLSLHTWLCTIGYQLLMAEAVLALYSENSWTKLNARRSKNHIHWIVQALGSGLAIAGTVVYYIERRRHFGSLHSKLGLASLILIVISLVNGIPSLWSQELKRLMKPVYFKFFHNIVGLAAFVVGIASLIYGYEYGIVSRASTTGVLRALMWGTAITCFLSSIGAFRSGYSQLRAMFTR